jgi:hypothetical protein
MLGWAFDRADPEDLLAWTKLIFRQAGSWPGTGSYRWLMSDVVVSGLFAVIGTALGWGLSEAGAGWRSLEYGPRR